VAKRQRAQAHNDATAAVERQQQTPRQAHPCQSAEQPPIAAELEAERAQAGAHTLQAAQVKLRALAAPRPAPARRTAVSGGP